MQADALRPGDPKRLGSYELLGRLGDGGQGVVFLGRATDGTDVAIKLLHRELTEDETARVRFLREIEFAKQVASFCTAQILDADIEGERPYLVSEYVPGPSVLQLVQTDGPISGGALGRLAIGTATALVAIHQAGVIHRDFKPANVLIGPGGPRVIDFGIARVFNSSNTMTSRVIGTPAFMAPEQLRGRQFGKEADIFCWGATMVYAATGRPPFGNDSIPAVIQRALNEEPDLGDITEPLRGLIASCLAKRPADRPDARTLLMRLLGEEGSGGVMSRAVRTGSAAEDPAAILVKIAEATARPAAGHHADSSATQALAGSAGMPEATSPRLREAAYAELEDSPAAPGEYGEPDRPGRRRATALTIAAIVAVAVTAGGTAYVLAQSESGVRHVNNNPTVAPVASETPSAEPTSAKPKKTRTPTARPTLIPTPSRIASARPSPTRTTRRPTPTPTPTKTRTSTPTPTPTPTSTPPAPTSG
jgi:hypothetical protein